MGKARSAMAIFEKGDLKLNCEEYGDGFPILVLAPGGMNSTSAAWSRFPWNPLEDLAGNFRLIGMDQRNAGDSRAPIRSSDGWDVYAEDHLSLLEHLGIEQFHILGSCIGAAYALRLMQRIPERIVSAVLQQPIGFDGGNRDGFLNMFNNWTAKVRENQPDVPDEVWQSFRSNMFDGDFVFSVDRDFVKRCRTPMLVLMGNDGFHPASVSREVAELAPNADLVENWKEEEFVAATVERVREFLLTHTPG